MAWDRITYGRLLYLSLQPVLQLRQRKRTMGKRILLRFIHLGVCLAFILEDRIPACVSRSVTLSSHPTSIPPKRKDYKTAYTHTKGSRTPRRHYLPLQRTISKPNTNRGQFPGSQTTYMDSPLKNQHLMPRPLTVRKRADSLRGFVFVCDEEIVETFETKSLEEPFSKVAYIWFSNIPAQIRTEIHRSSFLCRRGHVRNNPHIRPRQFLQRIKAQTRILSQNRSSYLSNHPPYPISNPTIIPLPLPHPHPPQPKNLSTRTNNKQQTRTISAALRHLSLEISSMVP